MKINNIISEGDVVAFPKKHKGDLGSVDDCPKCGGDLQGGKYQGHEVKVCMPCKQVYLPPNSGIDQKGNKIDEGSQFERKITRTQALIQNYYNRARASSNDIKRDHYIDMARQLEYELEGMINDANQAEQDSYEIAQHDATPSATWNRGGLEEQDVAEGLPKAQDGRYNPDGSKKQQWHKDPRWQQHAKDWEKDPKNIYGGVGKKKVKEAGVAEGSEDFKARLEKRRATLTPAQKAASEKIMKKTANGRGISNKELDDFRATQNKQGVAEESTAPTKYRATVEYGPTAADAHFVTVTATSTEEAEAKVQKWCEKKGVRNPMITINGADKPVDEGVSDIVKGIKRSIKGKEHPDVVAAKHLGRAMGHYNQGDIKSGDKESNRYAKTRDIHLKAQGVVEAEQQKGADYRDPPEADYGDDYQAMVSRVKKLAGLGPLKTVYDPAKRVYKNVPTAVQPKK